MSTFFLWFFHNFDQFTNTQSNARITHCTGNMFKYITPPHEVITIHVGYVNLRDETPIVLLYVFVSIFCTTTLNCISSSFCCCWRWQYVLLSRFTQFIAIPKLIFFLAQTSSGKLFITCHLFKPHFLKMLVVIHSYLLHKIFKSQSYFWI